MFNVVKKLDVKAADILISFRFSIVSDTPPIGEAYLCFSCCAGVNIYISTELNGGSYLFSDYAMHHENGLRLTIG